VHGQQHHFGVGSLLMDVPRGVDAVQERHADIQHCDARAELARHAHRIVAIGRFAHHVEAFALQQGPKTLTEHGVVVCQHDCLHHRCSPSGMLTRSSVPEPGLELISNAPCRLPMRSRMPTRPRPPGPAPSMAVWKPLPSSFTVQLTSCCSIQMRTHTVLAPECFTTLFKASCTVRYNAVSMGCAKRPRSAMKFSISTFRPARLRKPSARNCSAGISPSWSRMGGRSSWDRRRS